MIICASKKKLLLDQYTLGFLSNTAGTSIKNIENAEYFKINDDYLSNMEHISLCNFLETKEDEF